MPSFTIEVTVALLMPIIRFLREGKDVNCRSGEILRDVAIRENVQLYGFKGVIGNCGGCGQCSTCFVEVIPGGAKDALSSMTEVEERKLKRHPQTWRLACQALVNSSLIVLTRPQTPPANHKDLIDAAMEDELPNN